MIEELDDLPSRRRLNDEAPNRQAPRQPHLVGRWEVIAIPSQVMGSFIAELLIVLIEDDHVDLVSQLSGLMIESRVDNNNVF